MGAGTPVSKGYAATPCGNVQGGRISGPQGMSWM
jgi:hypothetical protein